MEIMLNVSASCDVLMPLTTGFNGASSTVDAELHIFSMRNTQNLAEQSKSTYIRTLHNWELVNSCGHFTFSGAKNNFESAGKK